MTYTQSLTQISLFEAARSGDFQAISYWINRELKPQGISARVVKENTGSLQVLVEFQREPPADRLIKFICHQLWKLNSPVLERVKIMGRFSGSPKILWKQSVRINSQSKSNVHQQSNFSSKSNHLKFKISRSLMLIGSVVAAFILGCWVSYYGVLARQSIAGEWVETAVEKVKVVNHRKVANPNDPTVTLMFGGDINLSGPVSDVVKSNYDWPLAKMDEYRKADLAMVNLENPLTHSTLDGTSKQQKSNLNPNYVKVLTSGGVDLVNLANDNTTAYEQKTLEETIKTLEDEGIHSVGAGRTKEEARKPKIIEVKGQKIAYLSYYNTDIQTNVETVSVHSHNQDPIASDTPVLKNHVMEDIQFLRNQVDWIIVNYHWGVELSEYPGDWQMDIARGTIDQGADVVVGHHPKVLQGAEIYKGRPIIYSLGNFIFGDNSHENSDYETAVLKVSLKPEKMRVELLPVLVSDYQPRVVKGQQGEKILRHIAQISSVFHQQMRTPIEINPINASAKFVGIESNSREAKSDTLSTPTLPESPQKSPENDQNTTRKNDPEAANLKSNNFPLPLKLNPQAPSTAAQDPFIKKPFIKEPFIELPRLGI